jgi:predicted nucleic acid-binding protein
MLRKVARDAAPLFLDTAYIYALVNTRDQWHQSALGWQRSLAADHRRLITTQFILMEVADGLATVRFRDQAARIIAVLQSSPEVEVIPASSHLFAAALQLYQGRGDKDWGLTDCSSFVTMNERGLSFALTTDEHFRQAGFRPLLLEDAPA